MKKLILAVVMIICLTAFYFFLSFLSSVSKNGQSINRNDMEIAFNFVESNGYCYDDESGRVFLFLLPKRVLNGTEVKVCSKDGQRVLVINSEQVEIITNSEGKIMKAWFRFGPTNDPYFSETNPEISSASKRAGKIYKHHQKAVIRYLQKESRRQLEY